jgi:hypothetical protein
MKTAKEWIASVKDPVIKRYLEDNVDLSKHKYDCFENFILGTFDWEGTPQHIDFWFKVSKADPSTLSYSDFKHLDKSVETQLKEETPTKGESILDYDLSGIDEDKKRELIKGFTEITAKQALELFVSLGLKTHIEAMVINDTTGDEFILSFKKVIVSTVEQPKVSVNEDAWISSEPPKDGTKILRWHKLWQCPIAVKANNLEDSRLTFPWVECSLSTAWPEDSFVKDKWMPLPPPPNYTKTT